MPEVQESQAFNALKDLAIGWGANNTAELSMTMSLFVAGFYIAKISPEWAMAILHDQQKANGPAFPTDELFDFIRAHPIEVTL